jgi:hypothetical protein
MVLFLEGPNKTCFVKVMKKIKHTAKRVCFGFARFPPGITTERSEVVIPLATTNIPVLCTLTDLSLIHLSINTCLPAGRLWCSAPFISTATIYLLLITHFASAFLTKYKLGAASSVTRALEALEAKDLILFENNSYSLTDIFLMRWFQRQ